MNAKICVVFALAGLAVVCGARIKRDTAQPKGPAGGIVQKDEIDIFIEQLDKAGRLTQLRTCKNEIDSIFGAKTWGNADFKFKGDDLTVTVLPFACFDQCLFREYGLLGEGGIPDESQYTKKINEAEPLEEKQGFVNALAALKSCLADLNNNKLPEIIVPELTGVDTGTYVQDECVKSMKIDFCLHKNLQKGATDKAVVALSLQILDRLPATAPVAPVEDDDTPVEGDDTPVEGDDTPVEEDDDTPEEAEDEPETK